MLSRGEILKAIILHSPLAQHIPMLNHIVNLLVHGLWHDCSDKWFLFYMWLYWKQELPT